MNKLLKAQTVRPKPDWRESFCVGRIVDESKTWTKSGCDGTEASLPFISKR